MVDPKSWTWVTPTSPSMVVPSGTGTSRTAIRLRLTDMSVRQTEVREIFKCYRFLCQECSRRRLPQHSNTRIPNGHEGLSPRTNIPLSRTLQTAKSLVE